MKKLIAILALVALTGNIASAELLKNFKYDGKIEINALSTKNVKDANSATKDTTSDVNARVQLNASFDLNEDVNAVVSAVRCWDQYGTTATGEAPINTALDSFMFEQTYLNLKGVLGFDHKVGRQYYGNEGDLVVYYGPRSMPYTYLMAGFGATINHGVEGYTGWYKTGKLDMNVIMAKMTNGASMPDTDTDLLGVNAKYDLMDAIKVGAYYYDQKSYGNGTTPDQTVDVAGVKAYGKFMGFDYNAEFAKNFGQQGVAGNLTGTGLLANVKYDLEVMGKWNFMGEFAMGTGDKASVDKDEEFQSINTDYRPGIIWAGVFGKTGISNLTTWNAGANWTPSMAEKLTVGAKFYNFAPTEDNGVFTSYGNELDISADWAHSANLGLKAYYAMFMPDADYVAAGWTANDTISTLGLALNVKF